MINLINEQNDIGKVYLYARDLDETKHKYLIKKHEDVAIKHVNNLNAFIECWNTMTITFMKILMITIQAEKEKS